jgi:adenosylcobinamide-GDP ribazoletransferase
MHIIKSLLLAFSMYSKIPMPQVEMDEKDMKYVMAFFPLVGLVVFVCIYIVYRLSLIFSLNSLTTDCIIMLIPILITGGIHIDGFMDTEDAIHSYGDREKKLEILKDSHIGAFAVIMLCAFGLAYMAALAQLSTDGSSALWKIYALSFYFSRICSSLAAVNCKNARKNGMLQMFTGTAQKTRVNVLLVIQLFICGICMLIFSQPAAAAVFVAVFIWFILYRHMVYKEFGGVTGDLAGYFLCMAELWVIVVLAVCSKVV